MTPLVPVLLCALAAAARAAPEDCSLAKARGSCGRFEVRYYYDTQYGGCLRFWYGGCDGNGNQFATEAECQRACVSPPGDALCRLPAVRGACKRAKPRWYSDPATGGCRQFTYSGCLGNDNRFESEAACRQRCGRVSPDSGSGGSGGGTSGGAAPPVPAPGPADCLQPDRAAGECSQYVIRYSYVAARQQCAPFYYGGCGGNANRFDTAEACQAACSKPPTTRAPYYQPPRGRSEPRARRPDYGREERPQPIPDQRQPDTSDTSQPAADVCSLPSDTGRCRAYIPSYYFDAGQGRCLSFIYGGCDGNENRFSTEAECEARCGGTRRPSYGRAERPPYDREERPPYDRENRPSYDREERPSYDREDDRSYGREDRPPYDRVGRPSYDREDRGPYARKEDRPEPTEAPRSPYQPETEAPYRSETEGRFVPFEPESRAPAQPEPEPEPDTPAPATSDICSLPSETGRCRGYMPSYYFDAALGRCMQFVYGGCGGNENRFSTEAACEARCGGAAHGAAPPTTPPPPTEPPETPAPDAYIPLPTAAALDVCRQPPVQGPCDQRLTRYYFNSVLGSCFTFIYGGCGGNGNRFDSAAACRARCRPGEPETTFAPFPELGFGEAQAGETTTAEYPTYDYGDQEDYNALVEAAGSVDTSQPAPSDYYDEYYAEEYDYQ